MSVSTLPSQKLKIWQKLWLEGKIGKWPEAQKVAAPQINAGSLVEAATSMSVSQAEIFFVQGANTAMKMKCAIAGDLATRRNKFTARQWAALIGFCGVETWRQVQNICKQIEKSRDATEVRTIVITAIKEQQVNVDRQSSRVWFVNDVAEGIRKYRFTYGQMANMAKTERGN